LHRQGSTPSAQRDIGSFDEGKDFVTGLKLHISD